VTEFERKPRVDLNTLFRKSNRARLSGVTKSYSPRHARANGSENSPGTPSSLSRFTSGYHTPSPARRRRDSTPLGDTRIVIDTNGPRAWDRNDWKLLDACLTDERLAIAEQRGDESGAMAEPDVVELDEVIDRFIEFMGGQQVIDGMGSTWTRFVKFYHLSVRKGFWR
jgi:hypothetical protein